MRQYAPNDGSASETLFGSAFRYALLFELALQDAHRTHREEGHCGSEMNPQVHGYPSSKRDGVYRNPHTPRHGDAAPELAPVSLERRAHHCTGLCDDAPRLALLHGAQGLTNHIVRWQKEHWGGNEVVESDHPDDVAARQRVREATCSRQREDAREDNSVQEVQKATAVATRP